MNDSNYFWVTSIFLLLFSFSTNAQDCLFDTDYEVIEISNNGDGTCDYSIDLCAMINNDAEVHEIEYSVMFDADGDGDDESIVNHIFNPGIAIPGGDYCLSSSAPAMTFTVTTPCGNDVMIVISGTNVNTNENCINLIEDVPTGLVEEEEIAEVENNDELDLGNNNEININEMTPTINSTFSNSGIQLYPTMAQDVINLNIEAAYAKNTNFIIADQFGKVVAQTIMEAGSIEKQIAVDDLQNGQYWLVCMQKDLNVAPQQFLKVMK